LGSNDTPAPAMATELCFHEGLPVETLNNRTFRNWATSNASVRQLAERLPHRLKALYLALNISDLRLSPFADFGATGFW